MLPICHEQRCVKRMQIMRHGVRAESERQTPICAATAARIRLCCGCERDRGRLRGAPRGGAHELVLVLTMVLACPRRRGAILLVAAVFTPLSYQCSDTPPEGAAEAAGKVFSSLSINSNFKIGKGVYVVCRPHVYGGTARGIPPRCDTAQLLDCQFWLSGVSP